MPTPRITTALSDIAARVFVENSEWIIDVRVMRSDVAMISISEMIDDITGCTTIKSRKSGCSGAAAKVALAMLSPTATKPHTTPKMAMRNK